MAIRQGDALALFPAVGDATVDLVFCDPPFNIGFDYGEDNDYDDNRESDEYLAWARQWMIEIKRVLRSDGSFWLAIGDEYVSEMDVLAKSTGFFKRGHICWYFTFGVNSPRKFSRSHTHLLYYTADREKFTFNADQIRVPSARALVYNDKRAHPDGRLPDDTWILRPQELPEGFPAEGDTWAISRVCGTFKQRQQGAANQMPEQLLGRIIRACSDIEDFVLDPMAGTGTTLAVAKKLARRQLGFEINEKMAKLAASRLKKAVPGDPLDGPLPQGG